MKTLVKVFLCFLFFGGAGSLQAQSGGTTCGGMTPICTDVGLNFVANTGGADIVNAYPTNNYGCMWTGPNPSWYYLKIGIAGNIDMTLSAPGDIDFVLWGPYASVSDAISNCGNLGNAPGTDVVIDCGITSTNTEFITIPNAQVGEVYVLVIANFNGSAQNISLTKTGGTAETDCSIVTPSSCFIDSLSATIGPCQTDNSFDVNGFFRYENSPASGSVTVTVANSSGTQTQTFNSPFVNGQDFNFSLNMNSDGSPLTVSVSFSADPSCSLTLSGTSRPSCACVADVGTFSVTTSGTQNQNNVLLCYGDTLNIFPNGDWTPPAEATSPPAAQGYDPDIIWLVYSCPPTVATTPDLNLFLTDDPCLVGVINSPDLSDSNDLFFINAFPPGTFTQNTVYFVPVTAYNVGSSPILLSWVNTVPALPCYALGSPYAVQYLPNVTFSQSQNCAAGTVAATVSGGLPAVNNSAQFTVVPGSLSPSTATFVNSTASNNGTITVGGLQNGDNYSFQIQDGNGCAITVTGNFVGGTPNSTTITYPKAAYCQNEPNPSPTLNGTSGGVYSSTNGLSINNSSGLINLTASTPGTYTVSYTPATGVCPVPATFTLVVNAVPTVSAGQDQTICAGESVTLTANGASTYIWDNGVSNGVSFSPSTSELYTVTGTDANSCQDTDQVQITVNPLPTVTSFDGGSNYCTGDVVSDLTVSVSGAPSWIITYTIDGTAQTVTGSTSPISLGANVGVYIISGISDANCSNAGSFGTQSIVINPIPSSPNAGNDSTYCSSWELVAMNASGSGGTFTWYSDSLLTNVVGTGPSIVPIDQDGTTLYYVTETALGCEGSSSAVSITIEDCDIIVPTAFTPDGDNVNDYWDLSNIDAVYPDNLVTVYNRWGGLIYQSERGQYAQKPWDGTYKGDPLPVASYYFIIDFNNQEFDPLKGIVSIVLDK